MRFVSQIANVDPEKIQYPEYVSMRCFDTCLYFTKLWNVLSWLWWYICVFINVLQAIYTLTSHYSIFGTLVNHLEYAANEEHIRMRGQLARDFEDLCQNADSFLCTMQIGLLGLSYDVSSVYHVPVTENFRNNGHSTLRNFGILCTVSKVLDHMSMTYTHVQLQTEQTPGSIG